MPSAGSLGGRSPIKRRIAAKKRKSTTHGRAAPAKKAAKTNKREKVYRLDLSSTALSDFEPLLAERRRTKGK
jgi:hypothetical protein